MQQDIDPAVASKVARLNRLGASVRTGGKGSVRRKRKAVHKSSSNDDKKLQSTLKRLGANTIPGIEEVNMFQEDGNVIHFTEPKVQGAVEANTYVVSGPSETKKLTDLLPGILSHLGASNLPDLKKFAEEMEQKKDGEGGVEAAAAGDDEIPELVEDFEARSKIDVD